jgi:hypothetical protein
MELLFYTPDFNTFKYIYFNLYLPYSFPTNLLFENEFKTNSEIIKEIESRYSNVEWIEIPTTLYELLVLYFYYSIKQNSFNVSDDDAYFFKFSYPINIDDALASNETLKNRIQRFFEDNKGMEMCWIINKLVMKMVGVYKPFTPSHAINLALATLSELCSKYYFDDKCLRKEKKLFDVIEKCLLLNYEIDEYTFLLYRTSELQQNSTIFETIIPYSLSFSMSLFGGTIYDKDASSFMLFYWNTFRDLYGWKVSKYSINKYSPLYIPPLNTYMGLFRVGEYSHPRFKNVVVDIEVYTMDYGAKGLSYSFKNVLEYKCQNKSPLQCQQELEQIFQEFKSNAIILVNNKKSNYFNTTNQIYQEFIKMLNIQ